MPKGYPGRTPCAADECTGHVHKNGYCDAHSKAIERGTYDPVTGEDRRRGVRGLSFEQRLARAVEVSDCWVWQGYTMARGHGQLRVQGSTVLAHRWVWENLVGPVPDGLELDHLCRNPPCVNPDHLQPVTSAQNRQRGAQDWTAGPCKHGHPAEYRRHAPSQTYCAACRAEYRAGRRLRP